MKAHIHNFSMWIESTNPIVLSDYFYSFLQECGFNVENLVEKHFTPMGYTAIFLLSESHFAIHTFPEEQKTYIELSSCVIEPFEKFIKNINVAKLS